ncbi:hypothetical protein L2111_16615, partial [Citrobacter portucalensis]|nr:hypothetical protein [Citrobacter portucalensis]
PEENMVRQKCSGIRRSYLGTLGAFDIEVSRRIEPERAIYFEGNNSLTISERIRSKFMDSGFSVSARNLYLRHKTVRKNSYSKIRYYYVLLLNQPCIFPWYLNDNSCYDMALEFDDSQDFAG